MYTLDRFIEITDGRLLYPLYPQLDPELRFENFNINSKLTNPATIFIAITGVSHDGHNYITDAIKNGCKLAIVNKPVDLPVLQILVSDTRKAYSRLCADYYKTKQLDVKIAGITGTNGKSTLHWLIAQLIESQNQKALCIGTLGIRYGNINLDTNLTTPDTKSIHQAISDAAAAGVKYVAMEVSSHALDQSRVADLDFDVAVFTNLTQDHLDYHGNLESYFLAKQELFTLLGNSKKNTLAVINSDDPYGLRLLAYAKEQKLTTLSYGQNLNSDLQIKDYQQFGSSSNFTILYRGKEFKIQSPFIANYNAYNLTAALIASSHMLKIDLEHLINKVPGLKAVPGRLESVGNSKLHVFVDYAHTPDALEKALTALKNNSSGKLWVVFGCGGDRDKTKRPLMGKIAEALADRVVVTSDNPRTENPESIIEDICKGLNSCEFKESDRRKAIIKAITSASANDTILIAGKGHEDYQIIGKEKFHFSDQEIVRDALSGKN